VRWPWRRHRREAELDEEIRGHLEMAAHDREVAGESPEEARYAARREFGNATLVREVTRGTWRGAWIEQLRDDLRYAWRGLRRSPGYALIVTLTLAIGIGANAAIISVIDTAFFRKLPVPAPERVVLISSGDVRDGGRRPAMGGSSFPDYRDLRTRLESLDGLTAYAMASLKLGDALAGTEAWSAFVAANYFSVLGVRAARGRLIAPDEDQPRGAHPVVVISDAMWKSRFGRDELVVGRQLAIGNGRFTIIGVAPAGFTGVHGEGRTDLWLPYTMQAEGMGSDYVYDNRDARLAFIIGRLAAGATLAQVQMNLDRASLDLRATYPELDGSLRLSVQRHDRLVPIAQAPMALVSLLLIWAMVGLLHLVACSNVASLMLARAAARRQELGIRLCLGASPGRILMQSLAEPGLLALFGAVGGVATARWLTLQVTRMQFMSAMDPGLDVRVLSIVALTAAVTMLAFGLLPAREASRHDPLAIVHGTSGMRVAGQHDGTAPLLVTGQVVVSLVLLANAAVLLRAFERQARGEPGFDASHLVVASVSLREKKGFLRDWSRLDEMAARAAALPGVVRVAASDGAPLLRSGSFDEVLVGGHEYADSESRKLSIQIVGPGYFATIGARLVAGREFEARDRAVGLTARPGVFDVVVVNEAMARRYWPGTDPIGKQVAFRRKGAASVIGVVSDIHDVSLSAILPRVYFPLLEWRINPGFELVVRTTGDPDALRSVLRSVVAASSLQIEPPIVRTMGEVLDDALALSRVGGICVAAAAAVALLLTTIGLYGLVASWGAQRLREIGIRLALGAQAWHVHRLLLGGVARLVGIGALVGLAGATAVVRIERAWWGPSISLEAVPLVMAVVVLALVAGIAAYVPSRRAIGVDPADVLHSN
jgi:predicted permease